MNQLESDTCRLVDYNQFNASSQFISYILRSLSRIVRARAITFKDRTRQIQFNAQADTLIKIAKFFEQTWNE